MLVDLDGTQFRAEPCRRYYFLAQYFVFPGVIFLFPHMLSSLYVYYKLSPDSSSQFDWIPFQHIRTYWTFYQFHFFEEISPGTFLPGHIWTGCSPNFLNSCPTEIAFHHYPGIHFSFPCIEFPLSWIPCLLLSLFSPLFLWTTPYSSFFFFFLVASWERVHGR